jgi:lipid-A-disaccharide synthase
LIGLVPGSRRSEIHHLLPVLKEAAFLLQQAEPKARFVIPTLPALAQELRAAISTWHSVPLLVEADEDRFGAYSACDLALAASGTVTLELAAAGTPMVIIYRGGHISAAIARRMVRVRFAGLPNLLLDRPFVPELLQEHCEADRLVKQSLALLCNPEARMAQKAGFREVMARLAIEGKPSERVAGMLVELLARPATGL